MNAAEKARLAREKKEQEKKNRKARLLARITKFIGIAFLAITALDIIAMVVFAEIQNYEMLAVLHSITGWVTGANVVAAIATFFIATKTQDAGKSENLITITSILVGAVFVLVITLMGVGGMLGL